MAQLTVASRLFASAAMLIVLSGCDSNSSLSRTFGLVRDTPDEFTVVTRAPLSMPPDFALRPPQPGAARPQDVSDRAQAESTLVPESILGGSRAAMTPGQAALVRDAGGPAPADIRQRVDQEAQTGAGDDSFIDKVLYWRKQDSKQAVVDADAEARRLKQNAALGQPPVTGDTPVIRDKKSGWFQDLFGWL